MEITVMKNCKVGQAVQLFEVLEKYGVKCSLEFKADEFADAVLSILDQPVKAKVDEDYLLINMGESNFEFQADGHTFLYDLSEVQIMVAVASDSYTVWFNSNVVPPSGIAEAKAYREVPVLEPISMTVDLHEKALIDYIRTLCFEDLLDATSGIYAEEEAAKVQAIKLKDQGKEFNAKGFQERAENLRKLAELLADSNADYRDSTTLE